MQKQSTEKVSAPLQKLLYGSVVLGAFTAGFFVGKIEPKGEEVKVSTVTSVVTRPQIEEQIQVIQASNIPPEAKEMALQHLARQKASLGQ